MIYSNKNNMRTMIFTQNGYFNYGNRLQLFALAKKLSGLNINSTTYWPQNTIEKLRHFIKLRTPLAIYYKKEAKLEKFTKQYTPKQITKINGTIAIVGSDQVWNPNYFNEYPYLLQTNCARTISYAASIGVDILTHEQEELFKIALRDYEAISVREKTARKLLQPLTNKKIEVVLDPTLLLDKQEYESLEKKPKNIEEDEKYILCYILGNRDHEIKIEEFAKEKGYKTIYFSDKRDSSYGVEEFLYLIHHAELVCTDSFHACVFSFIFERPFIAFKRTGEANYMYTRLQNLIDTFKLKNREFNGKEITEANQKADFSEAKKILEKEQEKSLAFLKKAIEGLNK